MSALLSNFLRCGHTRVKALSQLSQSLCALLVRSVSLGDVGIDETVTASSGRRGLRVTDVLPFTRDKSDFSMLCH